MKKKTAILLALIPVLTIAVATTGYYAIYRARLSRSYFATAPTDNTFGWRYPVVKFPITGSEDVAYSSIRDPGGIPEGLPIRLQIPVIGVDSAIEDALITPDGRMDVPSGSLNVAWFALGPHPGQVGSAVIGGHFGINHNIPFVFYKLDQLNIGDRAYIIDDKGQNIAFVVRAIKLFDRNGDATTVFTSNDGLAHLNLITCEGVWNQVNGTYPERRVVFMDVMQQESVAPVSGIIVFNNSLRIGDQGQNVVALQNALEQKGFLTMPAGVAKGLFGSLTRAAVTKYQASVGLPPAGFFGPMTRAKLASEFAGSESLPNTGPALVATTYIPPPTESSKTQYDASTWPLLLKSTGQFIQKTYANPLDAIITTLLLLGIVFMTFAIIK